MKELDPWVFVSVFYEMLGPTLWVLVAAAVLVMAGFIGMLIRDRGIDARRFTRAQLLGVLGGFGAVYFMQAVTSSRLSDIGGPVDAILVALIWLDGAIGTTLVAYLLMNLRPRARTS